MTSRLFSINILEDLLSVVCFYILYFKGPPWKAVLLLRWKPPPLKIEMLLFPTGSLTSYTALIRGVGQAKASFFLFSETLSGKREKPGPTEQFLKCGHHLFWNGEGGREGEGQIWLFTLCGCSDYWTFLESLLSGVKFINFKPLKQGFAQEGPGGGRALGTRAPPKAGRALGKSRTKCSFVKTGVLKLTTHQI